MSEIKTPTDYSGIYAEWDNLDVIGDDRDDDVWDFGANNEYPILKIDIQPER